MATLKSINPYTEELNWEFPIFSEHEMNSKIDLAHEAYLKWKKVPKSEKKNLFLNLAKIIEDDISEIAKLQTIEMWMLYKESVLWLKWTVSLIRWFSENFEEILKEEEFETMWMKVKNQYDPIWVIFWIAPRNLPYNQVLRAAVPNILAWNTTIYKHSSNVPMIAMKIEELFLKAGFPVWIYTNFPIPSSFSEKVLANKKVVWVNLTGSENAWKAVWSLAWFNIKPSVLELGWNDAFVVCNTSNLDSIVDFAVLWRMRNWWQTCNSSKRFIVLEKYYDEFCEKLAKKMSKLLVWDPMDEKTQVQPLVSKQAILEIEEQVSKSVNSWAKLLTGGKIIDRKWFFFEPTVLADVKSSVYSYDEEIFWPVSSVIKSNSLEESIKIANDSSFWLSACVFWDNEKEILEVASEIEAWMIFLNKTAASKASLPFGWVKKSWYWKENWEEWLKVFTNKKVIIY